MSTKATIIYNEDIHIYLELSDDMVHLEVVRDGIFLDVVLMPMQEWAALGLPTHWIAQQERGA